MLCQFVFFNLWIFSIIVKKKYYNKPVILNNVNLLIMKTKIKIDIIFLK